MKNNYKIGDIVLCKLEKYEVYFPCQVIKLDDKQDKWVAILILNFFSKNTFKVSDIKNATPLYITHHYWEDEIFAVWIEVHRLNEFNVIGNHNLFFDVLEKDIKKSDQFNNIEYQYCWQQLPKDIQKGFKTGFFHKPYKLGNEPLTIDGLNQLKQTNYFAYEMESCYFDDVLKDFLKDNPLIINLDLMDNLPKVIDLSNTHINKLNIDVDNVEEIILNKNMRILNIRGNFSKLKRIKCPFDAKHIFLNLKPNRDNKFFFKLERLEKLRIDFKGELNIAELTKISKSVKDIYIMGSSATITNINELKYFENLEFAWFSDVYGFSDFPTKDNFLNLKQLSLWSVPKIVGVKVKKEYANHCGLNIKQLRTEEWLKANLDNPLRHWDGSVVPAIKAKKAIKAYAETYKKLSHKNCDKKEQFAILKGFLDIFNNIEKKYGLDTIEVEDVFEAFLTLGRLTEFLETELNKMFEDYIEL